MRPLDTGITPTRSERIGLAFRHAEFGVPDPAHGLRARGFVVFGSPESGRVEVRFRDQMIALFSPETHGSVLRVADAVPEDAAGVLVRLFADLSDTAETIMTRLAQDSARVWQVMGDLYGDESEGFPFSAEDLFRVVAASRTWRQSARLEVRLSEGADLFDVVVTAQLSENAQRIESAFSWDHKTGMVEPQRISPTVSRLKDMVASAHGAYLHAATGLPSFDGPQRSLTQRQSDMIFNVRAFEVPAGDLTVRGGAGVCEIARDATPLLRCEVHLNGRKPGAFTVLTRHGGLPDGVVNGLMDTMGEALTPAGPRAARTQTKADADEDLMEAVKRLTQVDFAHEF